MHSPFDVDRASPSTASLRPRPACGALHAESWPSQPPSCLVGLPYGDRRVVRVVPVLLVTVAISGPTGETTPNRKAGGFPNDRGPDRRDFSSVAAGTLTSRRQA